MDLEALAREFIDHRARTDERYATMKEELRALRKDMNNIGEIMRQRVANQRARIMLISGIVGAGGAGGIQLVMKLIAMFTS